MSITTRTKKIVSIMARRYPTGFEITDGRGNNIADENPDENDDSNYYTADDYGSTYDTEPGIPNDDNSLADDTTDELKNDNYAIINNPDGADHHSYISGVETNQNHNLIETPPPL